MSLLRRKRVPGYRWLAQITEPGLWTTENERMVSLIVAATLLPEEDSQIYRDKSPLAESITSCCWAYKAGDHILFHSNYSVYKGQAKIAKIHPTPSLYNSSRNRFRNRFSGHSNYILSYGFSACYMETLECSYSPMLSPSSQNIWPSAFPLSSNATVNPINFCRLGKKKGIIFFSKL